ncbi:hypothetical protein PVAND_004625 [Polypedilum vanderplanki]|uniref:Steroid dehydrogenase n=1 Tax=Polypedilum vanderplanki TaxID=319348 RepID=A0A9J6BYA2_POLVA|nr:hypothetical protein PVAND_004625 [Polypedilum vanderplanki]
MFETFLICVGIYATIWYLYENLSSPILIIVNTLLELFIPSKKKSFKEKYGEWAVVTGATDGIGKQYAKELAKHGMNIVLISRTESKLIEVAKEIESMYSVKTKYVAVDFGNGKKIYEKIKEELKSMDIGILVNNVGSFHEYPEYLDKISEDTLWSIMNINVGAITMMSRMIIPQMKANKRGMIVNLSSGTQTQPMPLMTIYAASKIYVTNFTLALQKELKKYNVEVQLLSPMFVKTKMLNSDRLNENPFVTNVEKYTRHAVFTLGKSSQTTGYWEHAIQVAFIKIVPQVLRTQCAWITARFMKAEYLQKQKLS